MKWRFYGCKDFQKWGKMCLRVVVRTRARARSRCLPAGPWSNISPEVTRTAVAVCRYPHCGNCPERRVCCQSSECTTYRNCDVRARERRREREGREGGSLQTDQSALSAAESWTDEQCGETDRGAREGGGARRRMETPSSLSAVTVVQIGATLLSWAGHRSSCPGGHPMQSGSSWPRLHSAHPANETSLSVSWIVASFIYLPLFA